MLSINPLIARNNFVHENIVFEFANILAQVGLIQL